LRLLLLNFARVRLTVCVTGAGAGVDSAREERELEARKMLVNRAVSPASSARFVGRPCFARRLVVELYDSISVYD